MSAGFGGFLLLGAVVWFVVVVVTVRIAVQKGRRAWVWAILGILTGPIAMFAVFLMEPVKGGHSGGSGGGGGHRREDPRKDLYEVPHKK